MIRILLLIFTLFFSCDLLASGQFELWTKAYNPNANLEPRDIYVYLPPKYQESNKSYPVIYMHDGQNLFDPTRAFLGQTWKAQSTLNYLIKNNFIEPVIVVAIDNSKDRLWEYTPTQSDRRDGGGADQYLNLIVNQLVPAIDSEFRTLKGSKNRAMLGSSLGGLVSIYSAIETPNVFGKIAALSPSLWWDNKIILKLLKESQLSLDKVWLDCGSTEGEIVESVNSAEDIFLEQLNQNQLKVIIQEGAEHSEKFWAARLPYVLYFLFPKN